MRIYRRTIFPLIIEDCPVGHRRVKVMENVTDEIRELKCKLDAQDYSCVKRMVRELEAVDLASSWSEFGDKESLLLFGILPFDKKLEVFERLPFQQQTEIMENTKNRQLGRLLDEMAPDDRVDLFEQLPDEYMEQLFALMDSREVEDVKELLEYDRDSAGGKMTTEFVLLSPGMTNREALMKLQEEIVTDEVRNIYDLYVVDENRSVKGAISLQRLIASEPGGKADDIALPVNKFIVSVDQDQEEVARLFTRYELLSAPVVDEDGVIKGVITIDDVIEIIHQEASEDIAKMAGTHEEELLSKSVTRVFRIRWPWLFASWIGGIGALAIIGAFEETLARAVAVAAFIPVIMGMGGNIGVQSSTIVVRGIALGRVDISTFWRSVFKEIKIGLLLGLSYGVLLGIVAHLKYAEAESMAMIGLVAGMGICFSMTIAASLGALLPLVFQKLNIDPAVATGPIVTTGIDIVGLTIYFSLASIFLL